MTRSGKQVAFTTPADAPAWQRWMVFSPVARLLFFVALFIPGVKLVTLAMHALGWTHGGTPLQVGLGQVIGRIVPALIAYLIVTCLIERRTPTELLPRTALSQALIGVIAGTALFSAVVGVLWLLGVYHVVGFNSQANWLTALLMVGIGAGVGEEIMFRGVLYRMVEEGLGTWIALAVSALFFGAAHLGNPGATLWAGMAIAIEAGILFGLLYLVTRSLWVCMGLHAAWNFMQGTVYGIPVSGTPADGWLVSTRSGPDWLSGGVFGAEASVIALTLCSLCTLVLLWLAMRRGSLVLPCWHREVTRIATPAAASTLG